MHNPSIFREERLDVLYQLITEHPLATLITSGPQGLMANLLPFALHLDGENGVLRAHLARGNKQLDELRAGGEALVVFQGPQFYVTPSWYPSKAEHGKVVPTWNYTMVQVRGTPLVIDDPDWLLAQASHLTQHNEAERTQPWQVADAPADFIASQLKAIVGVEIPVQSIAGKFKLSQNRSAQDRQGVMQGYETEQFPGE
ncbi:FMN-binding negative transcriptional regulator [Methylobacillus flagellatus]|uniref:FMN-binding negative transcriptional regulator n=1 Tax=Methylobacillus flagellatus TaxID=405 RepID=UPI002853FA8A|nr:FMN-binding negative transcriptional regulator [Methylobacillus flagellatus]MDR5170406.1 FMN-binding negative transcriptional regulator [Methylobacillus flagellatus]